MAKLHKSSTKTGRNKNIIENKNEVVPLGFPDILKQQEILEQILGRSRQKQTKFSGELSPREAVEMKDVFSGRSEQIIKERKMLRFERQLFEEEKEIVKRKTDELRLQLHAISNEIKSLSNKSSNLAEEVKTAVFQVPQDPGIYHLYFFEHLLDLIKSVSHKIDDASIWLQSVNKRAQKRNYWSMYKKHGSKFLLSGEHYLTRSTG